MDKMTTESVQPTVRMVEFVLYFKYGANKVYRETVMATTDEEAKAEAKKQAFRYLQHAAPNNVACRVLSERERQLIESAKADFIKQVEVPA